MLTVDSLHDDIEAHYRSVSEALATGLHGRCGQHSPIGTLFPYLVQSIMGFVTPIIVSATTADEPTAVPIPKGAVSSPVCQVLLPCSPPTPLPMGTRRMFAKRYASGGMVIAQCRHPSEHRASLSYIRRILVCHRQPGISLPTGSSRGFRPPPHGMFPSPVPSCMYRPGSYTITQTVTTAGHSAATVLDAIDVQADGAGSDRHGMGFSISSRGGPVHGPRHYEYKAVHLYTTSYSLGGSIQPDEEPAAVIAAAIQAQFEECVRENKPITPSPADVQLICDEFDINVAVILALLDREVPISTPLTTTLFDTASWCMAASSAADYLHRLFVGKGSG